MSDWYQKAKCKGKHMEFWYPPVDASNPQQYYFVAKTACDRCPVWDECLEAGMDEQWGMWGGLTPAERKDIKNPKGPSLKVHGTVSRYRQGCSCTACEDVAYTQLPSFDFSLIPEVQKDGNQVDVSEVKSRIEAYFQK